MRAHLILVSLAITAVLASALSAQTYTNPVVTVQTPDPGVIYSNGLYYAVTTSGDDADSFPIRTSSDLVNWNHVGYVFPKDRRPKWAVSDFWAPEIHQLPSQGTFVVYFAARDATGRLCVGVANATSITGPYDTDHHHPLVRSEHVGMIDPTFHYDDASGHQYLIWKEDGNGNSPPIPTPIWCQQLSDDGLRLHHDSKRVQLITNTLAWEGPLVEAPWMTVMNGTYYLFYSGNGYAGDLYAVGVAQSSSLFGPYTKHPTPILHSPSSYDAVVVAKNPFYGPGHCAIVRAPPPQNEDRWYMVYHAWGGEAGIRTMMTDAIRWESNVGEEDGAVSVWPHVGDSDVPTDTPQPIPN